MNDITIKPRRSALYMPCSNQRALEKAQGLAADVLLFDLEDAVAPDAKDEARVNIVKALAERDYGFREKIVRVNSVDTDWGFDDLKALAESTFDGVCLPKVESEEQINQALAVLGRDVPIWTMIETPKGVINVEAIAAHPQVAALVMGTNDLAKELRVTQSESRAEFTYALGKCVMAARAFTVDILDGVYNQLDNADGYADVCLHGKSLGFDGKTVIHPKQLDVANSTFMPDKTELASARNIIEVWNAATSGGQEPGVLVVDGKLVEALHVESAKRVVAIVDSLDARDTTK
ncbi:(3S)-malyl-CoA thioesterase [BD1-7 clade bacterium]|uniref:(3S)-malyl-CoA thioesterase n=1 Tax=BD1-7 clade bacterium TaxID=2029982 RepID=A0A5S9QCI9_9GAMM|nr:(3S)-malyl-CoA thioesterase [BD1-7 clade bacterium]CAA0118786.1 (3S)-malyl-CoA thioesterase [BD1-7 clade bacterium]